MMVPQIVQLLVDLFNSDIPGVARHAQVDRMDAVLETVRELLLLAAAQRALRGARCAGEDEEEDAPGPAGPGGGAHGLSATYGCVYDAAPLLRALGRQTVKLVAEPVKLVAAGRRAPELDALTIDLTLVSLCSVGK